MEATDQGIVDPDASSCRIFVQTCAERSREFDVDVKPWCQRRFEIVSGSEDGCGAKIDGGACQCVGIAGHTVTGEVDRDVHVSR